MSVTESMVRCDAAQSFFALVQGEVSRGDLVLSHGEGVHASRVDPADGLRPFFDNFRRASRRISVHVEATSPLCAFFVRGSAVGPDQFDCCGYSELQPHLGGRISRALAAVVGGSLDRDASSGDRGGTGDFTAVRTHDAPRTPRTPATDCGMCFEREIERNLRGWDRAAYLARFSGGLHTVGQTSNHELAPETATCQLFSLEIRMVDAMSGPAGSWKAHGCCGLGIPSP